MIGYILSATDNIYDVKSFYFNIEDFDKKTNIISGDIQIYNIKQVKLHYSNFKKYKKSYIFIVRCNHKDFLHHIDELNLKCYKKVKILRKIPIVDFIKMIKQSSFIIKQNLNFMLYDCIKMINKYNKIKKLDNTFNDLLITELKLIRQKIKAILKNKKYNL